jgi:DNA mismatch endonuclease, patch repair protein
MADVVDQATRSRMMAGIRGKNTTPELRVRQTLTQAGIRFRLHRRDLPGVPDIVVPAFRAAIFVHGCFWHAHQDCKLAKLPSTRTTYWREKLERNVERDEDASAMLNMLGWRVLMVWECATRPVAAAPAFEQAMLTWLKGSESRKEIGIKDLFASM